MISLNEEELVEALDEVSEMIKKYTDTQPISTSEEDAIVDRLDTKFQHFSRCQCTCCMKDKKCECGAEKCGFNNHSDYCPKYKK